MRPAPLTCLCLSVCFLPCGRADAEADGGAVPSGAAHEVVHLPPSPSPLRGPRFAAVTLDLYVVFGNHPSGTAAELARRAVERASDVREIVHLTGYAATGADELAAEAALEADAQGRFWPFVDRLLQPRQSPVTAAELMRVAREVGLDTDRLADALGTHRHRPALARLAQEQRTTPRSPGELLVNGRRVYPSSDEVLATAIRSGRDRARVHLDAGVPLSRVYDRLMEEVRDEQAAQESPPGRSGRKRLPVDTAGSPARGPSLAPVTLVLFSNLGCQSCPELGQLARRIRERHPGRVREVWKHWLPPWGASSVENAAVELASAAELQGRFWELHDLVQAAAAPSGTTPSAGPGPPRPLATRDLEALARAAGIDPQRLARDGRSGILRALVERDQSEARRLELRYGPVMLVNGVPVTRGAAPQSQFDRVDRMVSDELDRGLSERLRAPAP